MTLAYRIELSPDDNDTFLVTAPAFPELATFAEDEADAHVRACNAIEEALAARIAEGADIPRSDADADTGIGIPLLSELKVGLYEALLGQKVTRAELARRLDWNRESVDRLFRLDHASRLRQIEEAYAALGLRVRLNVEGANGAEVHA